jgi:hypothetical protein
MPQDVRIWEVLDGDELREIQKAKLNLEERIESWLEKDISIIASDLLVIGRQVETDFGGVIDLLCLEANGDLGIIELKRDKTPREITAQALDYASWVKDLSNDKITEIANKYLASNGPLEEAFKKRFGEDLPEILNEHHNMLIVASEIDSSSERIIKYLSDYYGVGINAATFHYFHDRDHQEFLARVFLIEPSQVERSTQIRTTSKRKPPLTYEELQEIAESKGVSEVYGSLVERLLKFFDQRVTTRSTVAFIGIMGESRSTIFSIVPGESDASQGVRFMVYIDRFKDYFDIEKQVAINALPSYEKKVVHEEWAGELGGGFFKEQTEVERFLAKLNEFKKI